MHLSYKMFRIEARIRILARRFPETHHICLFACARRSPSSFRLTPNDRLAFDAVLQASLTPEVANEVIRQMKSPPDACTDMKNKPIVYNETTNYAQVSVHFKDDTTFEINAGWDPVMTASMTQSIEAPSNYVFTHGLQPDDRTPFNPDTVVSEYIEALESQTDPRTGILVFPDSLFNVKGYSK